jgi:hypothetical protein
LSDIDKHVITEWEWSLHDDFMRDDALLSDTEVIFMQDLRPLQRISEGLRGIADVNLVHHYARLVTDTTGGRSSAHNTRAEKPGRVGLDRSPFGHYFSDTPPYYPVAQYDLTNLKRWTLSTCRSLGLDFSMFSPIWVL